MYEQFLCLRCERELNVNEAYFDEDGFGYSTKLCKCPSCGHINVLGYYNDRHFDMSINEDFRFFGQGGRDFHKVGKFVPAGRPRSKEDEGSTN